MLHLRSLSSGAIINFHSCFKMELLKITRQCEQRSALFMFNFHVSSRFCWPSSVPHPFLVLQYFSLMSVCSRMLCCNYHLHKISLPASLLSIHMNLSLYHCLTKEFYFFPKYSAECLLLITNSLGTALLSVRHRSSDCLLSLLHTFAATGLLYFEPPVASGCHEKVKSVMGLKWLVEYQPEKVLISPSTRWHW